MSSSGAGFWQSSRSGLGTVPTGSCLKSLALMKRPFDGVAKSWLPRWWTARSTEFVCRVAAAHGRKKTVVGSLSAAEVASRRQGECGPALLQVPQVGSSPQAEAAHLCLARLRLTQVETLLLPVVSWDDRQLLA